MLKRFLSMLSAALVILAMLPVFASAPAQAWLHPGTPLGCQYVIDNGCAAAQPDGSFKPANLLTTVTQSGQNSLLGTHPMTFNIPGVDYGIGPQSGLTPQDPRTIVWSATTPCSYIGTGGNSPPNDYVGCYTSGTYPNAVLDNYDFSGTKIGKSALHLYMNTDAGAGSVMKVTNSYFLATASGGLVEWAGNWSLVFKNNQCDGTGSDGNSPYCIADDGVDAVGSSIDIEYNAFTNIKTPRIGGGATNATWTMKYNFMEINNLNGSIHGEIMLRNCSGARANCTPFDYYEGNFIVWDPPFQSGLNNATVFPGDGNSDGIRLSSFGFINNIVVTNKSGSTTAINQALFNARLASLGVVTMTGNWADAYGSDDCSVNGVKAGGSTVTASQTGTVVSITGLSGSFGNNPIEPGWQFFRGGIKVATILSLGTSGGNTGTVNVDTSASIGSDSVWTLVPGFTSATLTGNYNLDDPSHTGSPQAMNLSGPQFIAGTCVIN